ncbi:MAG: chromosome segregation protein SMC [Candidatus Thorarchaeota archaeon]|nr:chromosome segregation protein SMC [Candidatus Thorarchaeota archaeon]
MVHIQKLVCKGFKSFGRDSITIRMNPGFTCIVGPNGSGKSNVIDAVLFVLGQLSAKTLRANVFSDLLYYPPKPDMPPKATTAVVELHFNNKDRKLQVDADKVVVERQLDDSGRSTCRVNGKVVTRTAVLDLLGGIGVDPNGYNLVLQGEIAQMVKVSPIDRRKLIEEIAGISAYDEQKERALKKLAESETNLGKVETQLIERRRQLEKLELEREDALRFTQAKDQIQKIKVDSVAWTITKGRSRTVAINETLAERAEEAGKLVTELEEVEKKHEEIEAEIENIDAEIDQITGGDSSRISEEYGLASAAISHVQSDLSRAEAELNKYVQEKDELELQISLVQSQISSAQERVNEEDAERKKLDEEIQEVEKHIAKLEENFEREQSNYYEAAQRLQELNNQLRALDEGVAEVKSAIKSDSKELGMAYEEVQDADDDLSRTKEEITELEETLPSKSKTLKEQEELEISKKSELEDSEKRQTRVDAEAEEAARIVSTTRDELIRIHARRDALKDAEEAFLKRRRAISRILELRDSGEIEGIHGPVAELGKIDPEYSIAMEVAGGNRLSHIVVDDEDVASECIAFLKRERVGRASFIPLNKIKSRTPGKLPADGRVLGFAIDLVEFDSQFQPAFEFVFQDTVVTEDFETAKQVGFSRYRAVSLEGDLVEKSGLVTGGYFQKRGPGLSLQVEDNSPEITKRLQGLEEILTDVREQQDEIRQRRKSLEKEIERLSKDNYRMRFEVEQLDERFHEKKSRISSLTEKITNAKQTIGALEVQIENLRERETELTEHRDTVMALRDDANETLVKSDANKINQDIKDLKEVLEHHKREREQLTTELTGLQVGLDERLIPKKAELDTRLKALQKVHPGQEEEVSRLKKEFTDKEKDFDLLSTKREKVEDAVKDKRVKQIKLKEDLRNSRFRHEEIREAQIANEKSVYRLQTEHARLESDLVAFTAELNTMADIDSELKDRARREELTYKQIEQLDEKVRELEREQEALGAVNLKSLEDYDIEKGKYEEIVEKKTRLENEHKEIIAFMEELEAEKTRIFLVVYNEIADNFAQVFAKLSPGGEAALMLENPEHPLMGGITVRSKPRGKELVTLDAMSGGEKTLTGLALIFAIQMHSPASFYVFDEIDAALDDVNAHNVANLISEMARNSQFIVVSLRDTTVRKADLLVGVSNQDGISKIVSVDLEEVADTA